MVSKRDYYEVLGVSRTADDQVLKGAYRKLALQFHPDRNPGNHEAEEKFKEAAEAYSVLSDTQKRAAYDRFGHQGVASSSAGFDPFQDVNLGDILGEFFGFGGGSVFGGDPRRRARSQQGADIRYDLEITFEDVMKGMTAEIQAPRSENCGRCEGTGAEKEDGLTVCPTCRGRGEVTYQQSFLAIRRTCGQCNGRGQLIRRPCKECKGEGSIRVDRKLKVNIPAGVDNGTRLRLAREGPPVPGGGGAPGDLSVFIQVKPHPIFERQENDLHCTVPINVAQAALGTDIDLLTFDGLQTVKIPEGVQHGTYVKLRNLGVPAVNGHGRGDLFVHIEVRVPAKLNREQKRLFEQLRDTLPAENEPSEKGIFDKVKDYFM